MVPSLTASIGLRYDTNGSALEMTGSWVGEQFLVGDEGNSARYGKLSGYGILNASVEQTVGAVLFYLRASNLLDNDYRAFGILSGNVRGPTMEVERFLTPGHPRRLTAGMRIRMQK